MAPQAVLEKGIAHFLEVLFQQEIDTRNRRLSLFKCGFKRIILMEYSDTFLKLILILYFLKLFNFVMYFYELNLRNSKFNS